MLYVIINDTRYYLADETAPDKATCELVRAAQAAMQAAGVDSAPILDHDVEGEEIETGDTLESEYPEQAWALAAALDCSILSNIGYDGRGYGPEVWTSDDEPGEYWVLTDSEREEAARLSLDSYLDEMMSGWDTIAKQYFDSERFKEDCIRHDGYGHTLASYDGDEREACVEGTYYYVYRIN